MFGCIDVGGGNKMERESWRNFHGGNTRRVGVKKELGGKWTGWVRAVVMENLKRGERERGGGDLEC